MGEEQRYEINGKTHIRHGHKIVLVCMTLSVRGVVTEDDPWRSIDLQPSLGTGGHELRCRQPWLITRT